MIINLNTDLELPPIISEKSRSTKHLKAQVIMEKLAT